MVGRTLFERDHVRCAGRKSDSYREGHPERSRSIRLRMGPVESKDPLWRYGRLIEHTGRFQDEGQERASEGRRGPSTTQRLRDAKPLLRSG
jgi:hypothetical protein